MRSLILFGALVLSVNAFASVNPDSASNSEQSKSAATISDEINEKNTLPSLNEIRTERNLKKKVSMLLQDYEAFAARADSNSSERVYSSEESAHVETLKKAAQDLEKNQLNAAEKDLLLVSVNRILRHRMQNSPSFTAQSSKSQSENQVENQ